MDEETNISTVNSGNMLATIKDKKNLALNLMFDNELFNRCRTMANIMANAKGITPDHLIGKSETCYAVVTRSILWNLDPLSVANSTYEVKQKFGYEGKLCRAILEKSGHFEDRLKYKKIGDWSKVQSKFKLANKGKGDYAVPTYTKEDEAGLGVEITYQLKGEDEKTFTFDLIQAFPRNSTLWATDPWTQLCYLATRRFASLEVPDVFMGIPFDKENVEDNFIQDVTPRNMPVNPENRSQADDINEILQAQKEKKPTKKDSKSSKKDKAKAEVKVVDEEPTTDTGSYEKEESAESITKSPSQELVEEIITKIENAKSADSATKVFNSHVNELNMLPDDLYQQVQDALNERMNNK